MKRVIIDIDDAYAEVLTVTACGRDGATLNVHTQAVNLREQDHVRVPCEDKAKKAKEEDIVKNCDTCLYEDSYVDVPPCSECYFFERNHPSRWEPEEDEG